MPSTLARGQVDWKLLLSLMLLFFLAGSVVFQQKRISKLERELSLVQVSLQSLESKSHPRKLSFLEQYAPMQIRQYPSTQRVSRIKASSTLQRSAIQPAPSETPQDMLIASLSGDAAALDRLDGFAQNLLRQSSDSDDLAEGLGQLRGAFEMVSEEAGNGNEDALGILWRATRKPYLAGIATDALGHAAALGSDAALAYLLNPEQYGILESSAVGALIEPAQNGDETAIAALVQVALDPSKSAYWSLAVTGLVAAAEAGNGPAIQTLATLVNSNDPQVRNQARTALEMAAENGFQEADAALETQTLP
jgi:hypothetical protein